MAKAKNITVKDTEIKVMKIGVQDSICITDMAQQKRIQLRRKAL